MRVVTKYSGFRILSFATINYSSPKTADCIIIDFQKNEKALNI